MTMRSLNRIGGTVLLVSLLTSCAPKEDGIMGSPPNSLISYVSGRGYTPLKIPRSKWGPGTVVSFDAQGNENIVMFNDQCLRFSEPALNAEVDTPDVRVSAAILNNAEFTRERTLGADVSLEKNISSAIDVSGAFNDTRVKTVKVTIGEARQFTISDLTLVSKIRTLLQSSPDCAQLLLRNGNYIVDDILVVQKSSFSFLGNGNAKVKLDLGLFSALNLTPEYSMRYDGKSDLPVEAPSIIGYKLYAVTADAGSAVTTITATRLTAEQIAAMRTQR